MKLKVCGITSFEQLQQLESLGVDFAGMIFYEKSARFVGEKLKNDSDRIKALNLKRVGVFVNASKEAISRKVNEYHLDFVQVHGDETPAFCKEVQEIVPVIKAIRIGKDTLLEEQVEKYNEACSFLLFDTDSKHYGGTGRSFDWNILKEAQLTKPFFLSGGIGLEEAGELKAIHNPMLYAVDVNSRFETLPGKKDIGRVTEFINTIKNKDGKSQPDSKV